MNRAQWYSLLRSHFIVVEEIDRIIRVIGPDEDGAEFLDDLLNGLVQCCANVASEIDGQRERKSATPEAG